MITPAAFLRLVIVPSTRVLSKLTGKDMGGDAAHVELLAIAPQESGLEHRRQVDSSGQPIDHLARGWYQFEEGGGVHGVMTHPASKDYAEIICDGMCVPFNEDDVHEAIAWNGFLATFFARLLLWTDAAPLPAVGDEDGAWNYYIRNWRPGKPHPETWPVNYRQSVYAVTYSTQIDLSGGGEV